MTLSGLKKPKSLKRLTGMGRQLLLPPLPTLGEQAGRVATLVDDAVARLTNQLGDEQLAKRILKLRVKWPQGTVPELIAYDYLERKRATFQYQVSVLGGRRLLGGQVIDLVVDHGSYVHVWEIQGHYFHTRPGKAQIDAGQKVALMGIRIWGKRVGAVLSLWDTRLATDNRTKRQQVLDAAWAGRELGV